MSRSYCQSTVVTESVKMSGPGPSDVIPFGIDERMEWFVNNQRLADVKFIVGDDKETIFAHKFVLASGEFVTTELIFCNKPSFRSM